MPERRHWWDFCRRTILWKFRKQMRLDEELIDKGEL